MGFNRKIHRRQELLGLVKRVYYKFKNFIAIDESGDHVEATRAWKKCAIPFRQKTKRHKRIVNHGYVVRWENV